MAGTITGLFRKSRQNLPDRRRSYSRLIRSCIPLKALRRFPFPQNRLLRRIWTGKRQTIPDIALPAADGEITHFSRAYVPDARVEDIQLGTVLPLRELFGEGSADASFVFNEDGTFTDTLGAGQVKTGRYNVTNGVLNAIALPDETMDITVTEWDADGKAPVTFCVVYRMGDNRGYRVYYAEKV